jgi:thiamine pyrophosphokinase
VRCVWVVSGAPLSVAGEIPEHVTGPDKVVVADGGAALTVALGQTPDLLVGDFDSIEPTLLEDWKRAGVEYQRYEHHLKSETDTELAALAALRWKPQEIVIIGAIGGRVDHTLANVLLLTHPALARTDVRIVEGNEELFLAKPRTWNRVTGSPGDTLSLLPLGGDARGVTLKGLAYPLQNETLSRGRGRGVSNVLLAGEAGVRHERGVLLVIVTHLGQA